MVVNLTGILVVLKPRKRREDDGLGIFYLLVGDQPGRWFKSTRPDHFPQFSIARGRLRDHLSDLDSRIYLEKLESIQGNLALRLPQVTFCAQLNDNVIQAVETFIDTLSQVYSRRSWQSTQSSS